MNNKLIAGVAVALIAVVAIGFAFGTTTGSAAEPAKKQPPMMMQPGQMDPQAMADMMKTPQMQKQCVEMMQNADMQQSMMSMMKQPEMQAVMKQMLRTDAGFHQMMIDLVNSGDMNMDHGNMPPTKNATPAPAASGHNSHHQ